MNETPKQTRLEVLLSQDRAVSAFNFIEFRTKLEASIRHLERRALSLRRAQFCALVIFLLCVASVFLMQVSGFGPGRFARIVLGACGVIALFTTGTLAAIYQYRYAPALARAKSELTSAAIADLQQQVGDLSRKADGA